MSRLHFTSVKMFGQTVKIQDVESIEMPDVGACCGIYESTKKRIRIARDVHEDGPEHDYLKTVTHELMHAFADLSGLTAYLNNDDTKEEKLVQDFENHFWPVLRAIAILREDYHHCWRYIAAEMGCSEWKARYLYSRIKKQYKL